MAQLLLFILTFFLFLKFYSVAIFFTAASGQ